MTRRTPIKKRRTKPRRGPIRLKGAAMTALRLEVFERDGYQCQHLMLSMPPGRFLHEIYRCLKNVTWESGHLAHIISRGRGGDDSAENTCCKCADCHLVKEHHDGGNGKIVPPKDRTT